MLRKIWQPGVPNKPLTREECKRAVKIYDSQEMSLKLMGQRFNKAPSYMAKVLQGKVYKTIKSKKLTADGRLYPYMKGIS